MAKKASFNFGANAKPKKSTKSKAGSKATKSSGTKSQAWRAYTGGISNAPIPD